MSSSSTTSMRAVGGLVQDQHVDDADDPAVDERQQLRCHLPGEVAGVRRELDHEVVDRPELINGHIAHDVSFLGCGVHGVGRCGRDRSDRSATVGHHPERGDRASSTTIPGRPGWRSRSSRSRTSIRRTIPCRTEESGQTTRSRVRLCSTVTSTSSKWAAEATVHRPCHGDHEDLRGHDHLRIGSRTSTVTGVVEAGITRGRVISARTHPRPGDDVVAPLRAGSSGWPVAIRTRWPRSQGAAHPWLICGTRCRSRASPARTSVPLSVIARLTPARGITTVRCPKEGLNAVVEPDRGPRTGAHRGPPCGPGHIGRLVVSEMAVIALLLGIFGWAVLSEWLAARNVTGPLVLLVAGFLLANPELGRRDGRARQLDGPLPRRAHPGLPAVRRRLQRSARRSPT